MKFSNLVLISSKGSCEEFGSRRVGKVEDENDSKDNEKREEEKNDEGEDVKEFGGSGVRNDDH